MTPIERFRSALEQAGSTKHGASGWTCPAHDDRSPSLSVKEGRDGRVLVNCHADCSLDDILRALDLQPTDLFPPKEQPHGSSNGARPQITATYDYTGEDGKLLFQAVRYLPKDFRQRRRPRPDDPPSDVKGGWVWNLTGTRRVLYRVRRVMGAAERGRPIWIAEGEKDVHALEAAGVTATCNPMGAGKWRDDYSAWLASLRPNPSDLHLVVVVDLDPAGRAHAATVAASLRAAGCTVRMAYPAAGKDAADHLEAGLGTVQFIPAEGAQQTLDNQPPDHLPDGGPTAEQDDPRPDADAEPDPAPAPLAVEIHDFLNADEPEYDWLIPGLLERGDRVILTGPEGEGKSTLLRQVAVQAGAGIHPFNLEPIDPIRVLYVDLENSPAHVRRQLHPLVAKASLKLGHGLVYVTVIAAGIDFLHQADVTWLEQRIGEATPNLVIIGPLYKMSTGDPTSEEVARKISAQLDRLRITHQFALLIEAHTPHASGSGRRPTRPYGASMWLRWPEFGIYLDKTGLLTHWRGQRDERDWPTTLKRGGQWLWTATSNPRDELFRLILAWVERHERIPTIRQLEVELGRSRSTIQRAIGAHQAFWDDLRAKYATDEEPPA